MEQQQQNHRFRTDIINTESFFFSHHRISRGPYELPSKSIWTTGPIAFWVGSAPVLLRKPVASYDLPGGPNPLSPLWIRRYTLMGAIKIRWNSRNCFWIRQRTFTCTILVNIGGAQWLSGRMLDSRPRVRASPLSLRCGPWARHIYHSLVLVQPRKSHPCLT